MVRGVSCNTPTSILRQIDQPWAVSPAFSTRPDFAARCVAQHFQEPHQFLPVALVCKGFRQQVDINLIRIKEVGVERLTARELDGQPVSF